MKNVAVATCIAMVLALLPGCKDDEGDGRLFGVRFVTNGGSVIPNQHVKKGGKIIKPTDPTKESMDFFGWYKEASLENEWDFDTDIIERNTDLYAKWRTGDGKVLVILKPNVGPLENIEVLVNESSKMTTPDPPEIDERVLTFQGWYTDAALENEWDFNTALTVDMDGMILYAGWIEKFDMIAVEAGTFTMGNTTYGPPHEVTLTKDFSIGKFQVMQMQWAAVVGTPNFDALWDSQSTNPTSQKTAGDSVAIYCISWDDAQIFLKKLNAATGKNYRLPTEAEWEFAARGGNKSEGFDFAGSNNANDVAWHAGNSMGSDTQRHTWPCGRKKPNELGIYDMSGNVWEFCQDFRYDYTEAKQTDPLATQPYDADAFRASRGANWSSGDVSLARRNWGPPDQRHETFGFRLVL